MPKLGKSLLATTIVLTFLIAPTSAFSLPRDCEQICTASSPCWLRCTHIGDVITCCDYMKAPISDGTQLPDWLAPEEPKQTPVPPEETK